MATGPPKVSMPRKENSKEDILRYPGMKTELAYKSDINVSKTILHMCPYVNIDYSMQSM